jgi:GNAT superfamily N-acetyltransferase
MLPAHSTAQVATIVERSLQPSPWREYIFLAELDGEIAGFTRGFNVGPMPHTRILERPDVGYADELYVAPMHRGKGIPQRLVQTLMTTFWAAGVGQVTGHPLTPRLEAMWAAHGATRAGIWSVNRVVYRNHP